MRKHDVRKWLHAILDLLPVILIPVFMIYSHRHEINDGSIQVQDKVAIDFNQLVNYESYQNSLTNFVGDDLTIGQYVDLEGTIDYGNYVFNPINTNNIVLSVGDKFVIRGIDTLSGMNLLLYNGSNVVYCNNTSTTIYTSPFSGTFMLYANRGNSGSIVIKAEPQFFNLTKMFGSGNEPTLTEFNSLFSNSYYQYTLSHKELIDGDLITYNDTDIMSQITYQLYNSVDKYFNMGNVFNLGGLYDWFNLNIFNGNAPIYIFIVWQIVLYEFVMDLLFLLYGLFMWFIDMIQKLMEKPLNSVR